MKSDSIKNSQRGRACLLRRVMAVLSFGFAFVSVADEGKNLLSDPNSFVSFRVSSGDVAAFGIRIVRDEGVKQFSEFFPVPLENNALLVSGANINNFVVVAVEDPNRIGVVVELPADFEKNASQFSGLVFPGLDVVNEDGGSPTNGSTQKHFSEFKIDPFWHFLGAWLIGLAIVYFWEPFWISTRYWIWHYRGKFSSHNE